MAYAVEVVPAIPLALNQERYAQVMRPLEIRAAIADRVFNMGEAQGAIILLYGEVEEIEADLRERKELTNAQRLKLTGARMMKEARIAFHQESMARWQLEVRALQALLHTEGWASAV